MNKGYYFIDIYSVFLVNKITTKIIVISICELRTYIFLNFIFNVCYAILYSMYYDINI